MGQSIVIALFLWSNKSGIENVPKVAARFAGSPGGVLKPKQAAPLSCPRTGSRNRRGGRESKMFRKSILASTLLMLAITQAMAVNCDLSCVLSGGLLGHGACAVHARGAGTYEHTRHCHPLPARRAGDCMVPLSGRSCGSTFCKTGLLAITRGSVTKGSPSNAESMNPIMTFAGLVPASVGLHSAAQHRLFRYRGNSPLEVRSGTSLRL